MSVKKLVLKVHPDSVGSSKNPLERDEDEILHRAASGPKVLSNSLI